MKKYCITFFLLATLIIPVFSVSLSESYGEEGKFYSATTLAMGKTGILGFNGPETIYLNPASLADSTKLNLSLSYDMMLLSEHRSYPAYSFFDNLIGYQTYVSNQNVYPDFNFGVSKGFKMGNSVVAFGFSYLPLKTVNYDYLEEVRNETDPEPMKIANNMISREGTLGAYSIGAALKFRDFISFGIAVNMLSGEYKSSKSVIFTDDALASIPGDPSYSMETAAELSGTSFNAGLNLYFKRVQIGFVYKGEAGVGKTYEFYTDEELIEEGDLDLTYPSSVGIGIQYIPRNGIWTKIRMEYERIYWSQFENSLEPDLELDDVDYYKLGIEHIFESGAVMRVGFYNKSSYINNNMKTVGFTAGTGFTVSDMLQINVGAEVSKRKYFAPDLFADSLYSDYYDFDDPVEDRTYNDVVEEIESTIQISIQFSR